MAVRIRLKRMGRRHRPFFRVCAVDGRAMRDGRVIEELGFYDPMIKEKDARAQLNGERIQYWLSVGAQPSEKVHVLIKKYGADGSHLELQKAALERLQTNKPQAPAPVKIEIEKPAPPEEAASEEAAAEASEDAAGEAAVAEEETKSEEASNDSEGG